MSSAADERIAFLERELRVANEVLFLVLDKIGEPIRFTVEEAKANLVKDRIVDLELDTKNNEWVVQVVTIADGQ